MKSPQERAVKDAALAKLYSVLHGNAAVRKLAAEARIVQVVPTKYETTRCQKSWYWIRSVLFFVLCFSVQSILLHLATAYYVRHMSNYDGHAAVNKNYKEETGYNDYNIADDLTMQANIRLGVLYDAVYEMVKRIIQGVPQFPSGALDDPLIIQDDDPLNVPLWLLDMSALVPMLLCLLTYAVCIFLGDSNIALWTKTCLVAGICGLLKGICDVMTTVISSDGWEKCEERLGKEAVIAFRNLDFANFWSGWASLLHMEIFGVSGSYERIRYCSDMLISGHTYFAVVYSLSAFKMVQFATENHSRYHWLRWVAGIILLTCVILEFCVVLLSRFHYSVDMFLAYVVVFTLFSFFEF